MRRFVRSIGFSVSILTIIAPTIGGCTGSGLLDDVVDTGDPVDEGQSEAAVNVAPVASAGDDQTVAAEALVVLNASSTADANGDRLQFIWGQTFGTPVVTLQDGFSSAPRFFAPDVTTTTVLTFRLTVGDGQAISTDDVTITITP